MHDVIEDFNFLNPIILSTQTDENIMKASYDFSLTYKDDINSDFSTTNVIIKIIYKI